MNTDPNAQPTGANPGDPTQATGTAGAGTGVTDPTATAGTGGAAGAGGTTTPPASTCVPGIPPTSQVTRLLNREYDTVVKDLLGVTSIAAANNQPPSALLNTDFDGPIDTFTWNAYQDVAANIASEVIAGPNKANFIACDPATVATCYEDTIRTFGRKAFRRPVTEDEVARFMTLTTIQPAGTPDEIAEALLYAFLVSPSFIIVPEMSAVAEGTALKLSSDEVAMRLSLLLWGSVPDAELSAAADADQLQTPEQILAQANRMLQVRDKAAAQVAAAHRDYLVMNDASHWWKISHDPAVFPSYSDALRPALQAELDSFFEDVVFSGGSFQDMFLSNVGFVNQDTAALYGLDPAAYGPDLTRVELTDRPGFLTRAGFLSSFSSPSATSPILRGAFITVNLIGVNPGAPNPDNLTKTAPPGNYQTRREEIEALTSPAECAGCHAPYVNPPGYALENFNAVGSYQTVDSYGGPINATADVAFTADNIKTITTPVEMMQEIATNPNSMRIYAERLVAYGMRRPANENDACLVESIQAKLAAGGYTALNLFADLTQADSFRLRTVGN